MTRLLVIGDLHFKIDNKSYTSALIEEVHSLIDSSLRDEEKISACILLGDILDKHEKIHPIPRYDACEFLVSLSRKIPTYVLIGNHDRTSNNDFQTEYHPFTHMNYDNLFIIDHAQIHKINDQEFTFVPYVPNGKFRKALDTIQKGDWKQTSAIFAHQEFAGAQMGAVLSTKGDPWSKKYPPVFSGHIHDYQNLSDIGVIYVGMPYKLTYGENESKAYFFISFDSNGTYSFERKISTLPLKKIYRIVYEELDAFLEDETLLVGTLQDVKLVISCTKAEFKSLDRHRQINKLKQKGLRLEHRCISDKVLPLEKGVSIVYRPFSEILFELIKDNQELVELYQKRIGLSLSKTRRKH